jgi:hypothetical protein
LAPEKLEEISEYLKDVEHSQKTELERENKEVYDNLRKLISYWHQESLQKSEVKNASEYLTLDAYFEAFNQHLISTQDNASELYSNIRGKVESILTVAEDNNNYQMAEDFIMQLEFEKLIRYVPDASVEELLVSFEAGVGKLKS